MNSALYLFIENQITISVAILFVLSAKPFISHCTTANQRIFLWLFLAIKTLIPFKYRIKVIVPSVEATATVSKNPVHSNYNTFFFIWLIVSVVLFVLYISLSILYRQKLIKISHPLNEPTVNQCRDDICESLGITRNIPILYCYGIKSPLMTGIFKPLIILPDKHTDDSKLEWILRHELMHYKRQDIVLKYFFITIALISWFNPFIWTLCIITFRDIELACDSATVGKAETQKRLQYCNILLNAASNKQSLNSVLFSSQLKGDSKIMKQRLANILDQSSKKRGITVLFILLLCVAVMTGIGAYAENDTPSTENVSSAETGSSADDRKQHTATVDFDSCTIELNRDNDGNYVVDVSDGKTTQSKTESLTITVSEGEENGNYVVEVSDGKTTQSKTVPM